MSDLISRADAIEAVGSITMSIHLSDVICDKLLALPSSKGGDAEILNEDFRPKYMQQSPSNGADLISRADAIDAVCDKCPSEKYCDRSCRHICVIPEALSALPSAEAVQGEWGHMIADGTDGLHWYEYECSHCGEVVLRPYNFCPNCGADMRGGKDDER